MKQLAPLLIHALRGAVARVMASDPRRLRPVALPVLLLGGGAYALAAAVVSLGPDAATLPVRQITESVPVSDLQAQTSSLAGHRFSLYRSELWRANDTPESLLRRAGVVDLAAAEFLRRDALVQRHLLGRSGRSLTIETSERNALLRLVARWSPDDDGQFKRLVIEESKTGFASRLETDALQTSLRMASGNIESSLFASTDEAQIPDSVAIQIAEIFSGDIDFQRELRKGDRYSVVYEVLEGDGEPLRAGRVLSARFINSGKTYEAIWFQDTTPGSPARASYYSADGQSLKRAYLASPLAFSRVTSGFRMRFHPIFKKWTRHQGVDYAAPVGTPVRSVGDGVVESAGVQNGFGNAVFIRHRNGHVTVYAHLSRIDVRRGQRVEQGQRIGAVGATGWATGPHLHYEFRVNGQHVNPLTIARKSDSQPVATAARPAFERTAAAARQQLAAAQALSER